METNRKVPLGEVIKEYSVRNKQNIDYPVYSITNSQGFCRDFFSKEVASQVKTTYKIVPKGYFAYNPSRINVGSVDWQKEEDKVIVSPLYVVFGVSSEVLQEYLQYYLTSDATLNYINNVATGTVRANLRFETLASFEIPLPTIDKQKQIVAELDCISGIVDKKKQQLIELDNLALTTFNEMFGDPFVNEKGWENRKLEEVCDIINGYAFPSSDFSDSNPIKAIKITNVGVDEFIGDDSSLPLKYDKKNGFKVHAGDIVIALTRTVISGGVKRAVVPKEYDGALVNQRVAAVITKEKIIVKKYLYPFLGTNFVKEYILTHATALMQPNLSIKDLRELPIPYPPLFLQQEFASKIEAIEKQKELIKQSLSEIETLFNSRMDYYFN